MTEVGSWLSTLAHSTRCTLALGEGPAWVLMGALSSSLYLGTGVDMLGWRSELKTLRRRALSTPVDKITWSKVWGCGL